MGRLIVFTPFLIKSLKRSEETYWIYSVFYSSSFFFFLPKFCLDEFSVTAGRIVLKYGDKVDMDVPVFQNPKVGL